MTNREAIEYIERECHTCKGFYAPENECIAVPQDCFESKRLAISALQEREEREKGCEYCCDEDCPELDWKYGLDHIFPDYNYCPNCGRMVVIK